VADHKVELVIARQTGNPIEAEVARALLEDAGIPAVIQGAGLQDFLGYGRFGSGYNAIAGPVRVMVRKEDAEQAADVLAAMDGPEAPPGWWDGPAQAGESSETAGEEPPGEGADGEDAAEAGAAEDEA
jgi:hypothetical protein